MYNDYLSPYEESRDDITLEFRFNIRNLSQNARIT